MLSFNTPKFTVCSFCLFALNPPRRSCSFSFILHAHTLTFSASYQQDKPCSALKSHHTTKHTHANASSSACSIKVLHLQSMMHRHACTLTHKPYTHAQTRIKLSRFNCIRQFHWQVQSLPIKVVLRIFGFLRHVYLHTQA
jgi:hypothetical protein